MTPKALSKGKDWCPNGTLIGFHQLNNRDALKIDAHPPKMTVGNLRTYDLNTFLARRETKLLV